MRARIHPAYLAQGVLSLLLGLMLAWLCATRAYLHYVTPRMLPYLCLAALLLLITGVYALTRVYTLSHVRRYTPLLTLLVPLLLLLYSTYDANLWQSPLFPGDADSVSDGRGNYAMTIAGFEGRQLSGYDAAAKTINVSPEQTYLWLSEIYTDPTPFLGFTVHTVGQVLTDPQYFGAGEFSPSRKLMTCCVADLYTIGFKCSVPAGVTVHDGEWVAVTGKLQMVDANGGQEVRRAADTVEPCEPPADPYVYAN